jgi:hypothetical protein
MYWTRTGALSQPSAAIIYDVRKKQKDLPQRAQCTSLPKKANSEAESGKRQLSKRRFK